MSDNQLTNTNGIDNFRELIEEGYYYVDKTLMIRDFLRYRDKVSLITRPRRFGKTLNMTMMQEFFDINKKSEDIFSDLAIMETEHAKQMNSRPVVFMSFKVCSGANIEKLKVSLALVLKDEYFKHISILRESKKVDWESDQYFEFHQTYKAFKQLVAMKVEDRKIDDSVLKRSLLVLTRTLTNFYDQKPILLIDEYDQPLINAHTKKFRESFSEDIYADFLGDALKGNSYLHQALLTGIQRVAKESIFSKLNNFSVYGVHSKKYAKYFGLTEEETKQTLEDHDVSYSEEIKSYYDGYHIGGYDIYNPWSILSYLEEGKLRSYWVNTSTNSLIRDSISMADYEFQEAFEEMILDGEVEVYVNLEASFVELEATETLWGLLVNSGYLTIVEDLGDGIYVVQIPNREVKGEFRKIVAAYIGVGRSRLSHILNALMRRNMEQFLKLYQKFVYDVVSYHDVKQTEPDKKQPYHLENSYHMLFLGMVASVEGVYEVTSNLEAGDGRSDVMLKSLQPSLRPHVIIEFKQGDDVDKLKQEGLDQIFEKQYYKKLEGRVLCVGIAHNIKRCKLVYEEVVVDEFGEIERI